jgi:hypothetical protein
MHILFGVDDLNDILVELNTETGEATQVGGPLGFDSVIGIAYGIQSVPEPSSAFAIAGMMATMLLGRRKKKQFETL